MTTDKPNERRRWARELAISVAIVALLLVGAELLLRTRAAYEALPLPKPYYSFDVTRRLRALEDLRAKRGEIDVLFIGSSAVRASTNPVVFDRTFKKLTGREMLSFNGGFSGMFPFGQSMYLEHVWRHVTKPRYVLQGLRVSELTNLSRAPDELKRGVIEPLWFKRTWLTSVEARLLRTSRLLQYRGTVLKTMESIEAGTPLHARDRSEILSDPRGYREERAPLSKARRKRLYKQTKVLSDRNFRTALEVLASLKATSDAMGATFVVYHLAEHPERFNHKNGPQAWATYQRVVRQWADDNDVPFLDITDGDYKKFGRDKYYSDYHHMRGPGAERFSKLLARRFADRFAKPR